MDFLIAIFWLFVVFGGWRLVIWLLGLGAGAAMDTVKGKGSFSENVNLRRKGMPPFEARLEEGTIGDDGLAVWHIKIRGLFPLAATHDVSVAVSVIDTTDSENAQPVFAAIDEFQEPLTRAFQFVRGLGECQPNQGFARWVEVGFIPKDLLMYPHSGQRKIGVVVRLIDTENPPDIEFGFADSDHAGSLFVRIVYTEANATRGFLERSEEEMAVAAASLRLGISLAYSDGNFDPLEGRLIKEWASKYVSEVPEGKGRDDARAFINDAIRYGNQDAKDGNLSVSHQVTLLNQKADKAEKYAALELCMDVMAADGAADQAELKMLNNLCESLGLDSERFNKLRDHRMINIDSAKSDGENLWDLLGIDASASDDDKRTELKKLYRRWNSRAESLDDGAEREKAQQMLERIAEARSLIDA